MMARKPRLHTKGVTIDTVQLKDELRDLARATRQAAADLAEESLKAQIEAINKSSTNRRSAIASDVTDDIILASKGTRDKPLRNARVRNTIKRNTADTRGMRMFVYVDHIGPRGVNIFNILDAGIERDNRIVPEGTMIVFPAYVGHLIPDDPDIADPDQVASIINAANVVIKRDYKGNAEMVVLREGRSIRGFPGKRFYEKTAKWVEKQLLARKIVSASKRTALKLKANDVKITVPKRRYFKAS